MAMSPQKAKPEDLRPDWRGRCHNCGSSPTVPLTGLCGPCTFGTAEAVGGGWWDEDTQSLSMDN